MPPVSHENMYLPPSSRELDLWVQSAKNLVGHRLQDIEVSEAHLGLGLYAGHLSWLWMDLRPRHLGIFILNETQRPKVAVVKKPLSLFLNAHFRNHRLVAIERRTDQGRVLILRFGSDVEIRTLEFILIPGYVNIIAVAGDKRLSFAPVRTLPVAVDALAEKNARQPEQVYQQWAASQSKKSFAVTKRDDREVQSRKLEKAIAKVEKELEQKSSAPLRRLGEYLLAHQTLDVPSDLKINMDSRLSLAQQIELAFQKAKDLEHKQVRTRERLDTLRAQLLALRSGSSPVPKQKLRESKNSQKQRKYDARTLKMENDMEFRVGRSAKDNLLILRESRGWDYWLHLKDAPGSHGILFRQKNQNVTDEMFRKAAHFLIAQMGKKSERWSGTSVEVLIAETRFVRPIKGDKLGRVNYQNERIIRFRYEN